MTTEEAFDVLKSKISHITREVSLEDRALSLLERKARFFDRVLELEKDDSIGDLLELEQDLQRIVRHYGSSI